MSWGVPEVQNWEETFSPETAGLFDQAAEKRQNRRR